MAGKTHNKENHRNTDMASDSVINSSFDEKQWVVWVEELIQRDLEEATRVPASIFPVPESTSKHNPESYIPTRVALGPYNHFLPELFRMEVYKIHKAKLARTKFQLPQFRHLVNEIRQRELTIRACFYKYIPMECETFAWVMVIDGLYLIWLLGISTDTIGNPGDLTGEKTTVKVLAANKVERDVLLLENQIPMEVLQRIMTANGPNEDLLLTLLFNYCAIVSPFELSSSSLELGVLPKSYHLLHFLYNLISIPIEINQLPGHPKSRKSFNCLIQILKLLGSISGAGFIQPLSELLDSLKTLSDVRESGRNLLSFEEIPDPLLPSASKLAKASIRFISTPEGIKGVTFWDRPPRFTLILPSIRVNYFSEMILKNLVAFEATSKMGPPVLARYIGLMNGLVQAPEDVKILKRARIVSNDLGSDEEVVELFSRIWNYAVDMVSSSAEDSGDEEEGEMESVKAGPFERGLLAVKRAEEGQAEKLISLPVLGKRIEVIEDVNKYYYSLRKVKVKKFFKKYVLSSVKILFLVLLFCILILVVLRTICSFFSCPAFLKSS